MLTLELRGLKIRCWLSFSMGRDRKRDGKLLLRNVLVAVRFGGGATARVFTPSPVFEKGRERCCPASR